MLRSGEAIQGNQTPIHEKLILNPLELLVYQLQSKDISSKKQSIESVQVIALTMSQKEITNSLLPFLMKTLVEENNKELKLSILKSFSNIFPLLSRQKSYLRFLEILIDIIIAFEQTEIRNQALSILSMVLFEKNLLEFEKFKETLKTLATIELKQITQASTSKNAKQLSLYLIKYLFQNSHLCTENQTKQVIQFLKTFFMSPSENADFTNLKILAENFHLLVESWPSNFNSELTFFIEQFIGSESQESKDKTNEDFEPQKSNEKLQNKQKPRQIPKQVSSDIKCKIVPSLIAYAKKIDIKTAYLEILSLLKEDYSKIKVALIKKTNEIFQTFKDQDLGQFLILFRNFSEQNHDIKKTILQVIDEIKLEQTEKNETIIKNCKNAVDLKNILIQSLIRGNKSETVSQVLNESDYDFKVKIFTKLPDSMLHKNQMYAQIMESLLSEPKKNFRSKLNIILNLISRIEENASRQIAKNNVCNLAQTFDISYLITLLVKYFGDRIAIIRVNAAKLYALLIHYYSIDFSSVRKSLEDSFYGKSKGWFERQNVLIMIKEYVEIFHKQKQQNKMLHKITIKNRNQEFYSFIVKTLKDGLSGSWGKGSSIQYQKSIIKNISSLAEQIINQYSVEA